MKEYTQFVDPDGNIKPNSYQLDSENPSTFNAMYYLLLNEVRGLTLEEVHNIDTLIRNKYETNGGKYKTNDYDNDDSFSLDESISIGAMCAKFSETYRGFPFSLHLSVLRICTKQTYYRFYDVIPYLIACKVPFLRPLLMPYLSLSMILAVAVLGKRDSSGAQLNFIKALGLSMHRTLSIMEYILEKKGESMKDKLQIYYPEADHPTNILARKYYGGE